MSATQRDQVLEAVHAHVAGDNLRRHMLAAEAIMRRLAARFGEDPEAWGLAGLAHDLDAEETEADFPRHGAVAAEVLRGLGVADEVARAVAAHNPETGVPAWSRLEIALLAGDQVSGLITAAALVRPEQDLAGVKLKSVRKRYRETAFARGVDRAAIARCEELGLELDEFLALSLEAMQGVAPELGL